MIEDATLTDGVGGQTSEWTEGAVGGHLPALGSFRTSWIR